LEAVENAAEGDASQAGSKFKATKNTTEPADVEPEEEKVSYMRKPCAPVQLALMLNTKSPSDLTDPKEKETEDSKVDKDEKDGKDGKDGKSKKDKKKWKVGFGLFGKVSITKVPNSKVPLEARYWIRTGSWKKEEKDDKSKKDKNTGDDGDQGEDGEKKTDKLDGKNKKDETENAGDKATEEAITEEEKPDKGEGEKDGCEEKGKKDKKAGESESKYECELLPKTEDLEKAADPISVLIKVGKWKDFCAISNLDVSSTTCHCAFGY
jgi:hypothetical protein